MKTLSTDSDSRLHGVRSRETRAPLLLVCAPDSFKGSLTARAAARAMRAGAERAAGGRRLEVREIPLADGGEGTVEALLAAQGGARREVRCLGPDAQAPREIEARLGLLAGATVAAIEMAAAAGLTLLAPERRNPLRATTFGVGQMIAAALEIQSVRTLLVGVGGSATCDGGAGMAQALGARFFDAGGNELAAPLSGADLARVARFDLAPLKARLAGREIIALCDVRNPLLGPSGAAPVYAPQKGARPEDVRFLEAGLARLADLWSAAGLGAHRARPGGGAGGGLAAGLAAFCGARLTEGVEWILDAARFDERIRRADLILTGEGDFNAQSLRGKVVSGVARRARGRGIPVIVIAGGVSAAPPESRLRAAGITAAFSLAEGPGPEEKAMAEAAALLRRAAGRVMRLWLAGRERGAPVRPIPGGFDENESRPSSRGDS